MAADESNGDSAYHLEWLPEFEWVAVSESAPVTAPLVRPRHSSLSILIGIRIRHAVGHFRATGHLRGLWK